VFGKFVCKPNCSGSEAFVNRGLTVYDLMFAYEVELWSDVGFSQL